MPREKNETSKRRRANTTTTARPEKKKQRVETIPSVERDRATSERSKLKSTTSTSSPRKKKTPSRQASREAFEEDLRATRVRFASTDGSRPSSRTGSRSSDRASSERSGSQKRKKKSKRKPDPWTLCPPHEAKSRMPPELIEQYELAGLEFHEPLPRGLFPHRAFELRDSKKPKKTLLRNHELNAELNTVNPPPKGTHKDGDVHRVMKPNQTIRQQTVLVLIRIMHRSFMEGEYARASRAFTMLLRTRFKGKSINLRRPENWGPGLSLILEKAKPLPPRAKIHEPIDTWRYRIKRKKVGKRTQSWMHFYPDTDEEEEARQEYIRNSKEVDKWAEELKSTPAIPERLWGEVQDYFELLISRYPASQRDKVDRQNAGDFYYDMYVLWLTHIEELRRTEELKAHKENPGDDDAGDDDRASEAEQTEPKAQQTGWKPFDESNLDLVGALHEIYMATHERVTALAEHMDEVVRSLPFSDDHDLILLRAQVERWLADLCVPLPARLRFPITENFSDDEDYSEEAWTNEKRRGDPDYSGSDSEDEDRTEALPTKEELEGIPKRLQRAVMKAFADRARHRRVARKMMFRSSYLARTAHLRVNSFQSEADALREEREREREAEREARGDAEDEDEDEEGRESGSGDVDDGSSEL